MGGGPPRRPARDELGERDLSSERDEHRVRASRGARALERADRLEGGGAAPGPLSVGVGRRERLRRQEGLREGRAAAGVGAARGPAGGGGGRRWDGGWDGGGGSCRWRGRDGRQQQRRRHTDNLARRGDVAGAGGGDEAAGEEGRQRRGLVAGGARERLCERGAQRRVREAERSVQREPLLRLQLREVARVDGQPRGDARRVARPRQPSRCARCAQQGELLVVRHDARASLGRDAQQRQGPAAEEVPEEGAQAQSQHQVPLLVRANKDGGDVLPAQLDGHLVVQRGLRPLATSVLPHGVPAVRLLVGGAEPFEGGEA